MARLLISILAASLVAFGQARKSQEPPEEDETRMPAVKEYSFNPLQAEKEMKTGDFYWKKGSHKAAARRYEEATKWNPGLADAWFRLAAAREKTKDFKGARAAYSKFLEVAPADKRASQAKKRMAQLPSDAPHS